MDEGDHLIEKLFGSAKHKNFQKQEIRIVLLKFFLDKCISHRAFFGTFNYKDINKSQKKNINKDSVNDHLEALADVGILTKEENREAYRINGSHLTKTLVRLINMAILICNGQLIFKLKIDGRLPEGMEKKYNDIAEEIRKKLNEIITLIEEAENIDENDNQDEPKG